MSEDVKTAIVYSTFPEMESARRTADALVDGKLAACVHMLPGMTSVYRWQGEVESAQEVVVVVKTRAELTSRVIAVIEAEHPYDTPAAVVLDIVGGSPRYLDWLVAQTVASES